MNDLENYIQHYFSISVEDCKKVASLFKMETLEKGAYFLKTGKYCDKLSFIQEGLFRIFVSLPDKEVTQWIAPGGYFVTDIGGFLFRTPSRWNIQAFNGRQDIYH